MSGWIFSGGVFGRRPRAGIMTGAEASQPIRFRKLNTETHDQKRDLYHWLLTLTWPRFAAFIFAAYIALNLLYSLAYFFGGGVEEMRPHSYSDAFFFSVETLATVGYGHMYPSTTYAHLVTTCEIVTGLFGLAVVTGLIFVRFSRPVAGVVFSNALVWRSYDGRPSVMFRVANIRQEAMAEAEFRLMFLREQLNREGEQFVRFYQLRLECERLIAFPAAITIRHIITEDSPLHGLTAEDFQKYQARFLASVVCIDTVISAPVQSRKYYSWRDLQFGRRFVEIYSDEAEDLMTVDYGRFHDTEDMPPVPRPPGSSPHHPER